MGNSDTDHVNWFAVIEPIGGTETMKRIREDALVIVRKQPPVNLNQAFKIADQVDKYRTCLADGILSENECRELVWASVKKTPYYPEREERGFQ
jgi:hypothetical protein